MDQCSLPLAQSQEAECGRVLHLLPLRWTLLPLTCLVRGCGGCVVTWPVRRAGIMGHGWLGQRPGSGYGRLRNKVLPGPWGPKWSPPALCSSALPISTCLVCLGGRSTACSAHGCTSRHSAQAMLVATWMPMESAGT